MGKRIRSISIVKVEEKHQKNEENNTLPHNNNKAELEALKTFFRDLIAHRQRDPAVLKREELWRDVIEKFSHLVRLLTTSSADEDELVDFLFFGSVLECSTEFYAAELDSLSNEVYKLTSLLQRSENKQPSKRQRKGEMKMRGKCLLLLLTGDIEDSLPGPAETPTENRSVPRTAPQPRRHIIKRIRTVVEPAQLNAKLDTYPLSSPIFQKLNSHVGDMYKANQMIRNILPARHICLHEDRKFWNTSDESTKSSHPSSKVELPMKLFENFNSLQIRREIDLEMLLKHRRVAVTVDEEDP